MSGLQDPWTHRWSESKWMKKNNCFGMIQWNAVRKEAGHFLPKHTATVVWQYRTLSHVEQDGLPPMPKDRGVEQGGGSSPRV